MKLSPKLTRNLFRIMPFAVIWLITGWVFLFVETIATGNQNNYPDQAITLSFPVLVFASLSLIFVGLLIGLIELVILEKKFRYYSFKQKLGYKFLIYIVFMLLLILITFSLAATIELQTHFFDIRVWKKTARFFQGMIFINTSLQLSFQLLLSLLYAAISENLGHNVLFNFFTGQYHKPKEEQRIFMFLDMKNSTTIAEQLGHPKYFKLLQEYYECMSDPIIDHLGEVYQYIGDEVVVTWKQEAGARGNNCINCFYAIKKSIENRSSAFENRFGLVPSFKAGIHLGDVTTGEVGALKKEIVYTGDVLNTTARIQSMCKTYHSDLLVSEELLNNLQYPEKLTTKSLGEIALKGKNKVVKLVSVG